MTTEGAPPGCPPRLVGGMTSGGIEATLPSSPILANATSSVQVRLLLSLLQQLLSLLQQLLLLGWAGLLCLLRSDALLSHSPRRLLLLFLRRSIVTAHRSSPSR